MELKTLEPILRDHPFFRDLPEEYFSLLVGCASNRRANAGDYLTREGEEANEIFLLRHGSVVVEANMPGRGTRAIETLHEGDIVGWFVAVPAISLALQRALWIAGPRAGFSTANVSAISAIRITASAMSL